MDDMYKINTLSKTKEKKPSKLGGFFKAIFCNNIVLKLVAIIVSCLFWIVFIAVNGRG